MALREIVFAIEKLTERIGNLERWQSEHMKWADQQMDQIQKNATDVKQKLEDIEGRAEQRRDRQERQINGVITDLAVTVSKMDLLAKAGFAIALAVLAGAIALVFDKLGKL